MGWQVTTPGDLATLARAALATAFPRAHDATGRGRDIPAALLPAFAVAVERSEGEPAAMGSALVEARGELRVEVFVRLDDDTRADLAALTGAVDAAILTDPALDAALGDLAPGEGRADAEDQADRLGRLDLAFAISWLERPAALPSLLARFGLA